MFAQIGVILLLWVATATAYSTPSLLHSKSRILIQNSYYRSKLTRRISSNIINKSSRNSRTELGYTSREKELIGEDAATFDLSQQKLSSWLNFGVAVSGVLGVLYYVWLYGGGPQLGNEYKDWMESLARGDSTLAITFMLGFFAICHSGLASIRPKAEEIVGARVWRYVFALVSLPLAFSAIVYFINHRYVVAF